MRSLPAPIILSFLVFTSGLANADDVTDRELLLEKAGFLESIQGKPRDALRIYRGIQKAGLPAQTNARAMLGEAVCLDALGQDELARRKFLELLARYPRQEEIGRIARGYITSRLWDTPASYMPEKMLFYAEMVKPGNEIIRLSSAIRGTPFENPVDSSRTLASDPDALSDRAADTGSARWISAFLSKALFRELSKMGGVAFGIPAGGAPGRNYIAVLSPGKSDALSGYITSILSLAKTKRVVGFIQDMPLYEIEEGSFLAAGENVVVVGRPRQMVEEAVNRHSNQAASLATNPEFVNAWARKKDALMFFYLDRGYPFPGPGEEPSPDPLGLTGIGPISIAISTDPADDTLHATMWTSKKESRKPGRWSRLSTDPIDLELIRSMPPESLGFFALSATDMKSKLADISTWLARLPGGGNDALADGLWKPLGSSLKTEPFSSLLRQTRALVIGSYPNAALLKLSSSVKEIGNLSALQIYRPLYFAALQFKDPDAGEKILRDALGKYAASLPGVPGNLAFRQQPLGDGENSPTHHYLEPLLGIRPGYIRIRDQFIIAMSPVILKAAIRSRDMGNKGRFPLPAPGSAKFLYLRPKPIFSALAILRKSIPVLALKNMKTATLSTREEEDTLAIDLTISDLLSTLNGFLGNLAEYMAEQESFKDEK